MAVNKRDVMKLPHHTPMDICVTRAKYRQGKKLTAVKVYTVNSESQHLLVCGVPSLGLQDELRRLCARFGDVKSLVFVPKYAEEEFTDVYHVQYSRIQSARYAKHNLDCRSFYGGILHVCYAPEMESVVETRAKLIQRRKDVSVRTREDMSNLTEQSQSETLLQPRQYHRRKKHPALPFTGERLAQLQASDANCIWQGVPQSIDPRTIAPAPVLMESTKVYGPQQLDDSWALAGIRERRTVTNYRHMKQSVITTEKLSVDSTFPSSSSKNNNSVFRFIPRQVITKKRIVFRDKLGNGKQEQEVVKPPLPEDMPLSLKRSSEHLETNDISFEASITEVRKKIKVVSVPNIEIVLEREEDPLAKTS